jgi:hypothetical protein
MIGSIGAPLINRGHAYLDDANKPQCESQPPDIEGKLPSGTALVSFASIFAAPWQGRGRRLTAIRRILQQQ